MWRATYLAWCRALFFSFLSVRLFFSPRRRTSASPQAPISFRLFFPCACTYSLPRDFGGLPPSVVTGGSPAGALDSRLPSWRVHAGIGDFSRPASDRTKCRVPLCLCSFLPCEKEGRACHSFRERIWRSSLADPLRCKLSRSPPYRELSHFLFSPQATVCLFPYFGWDDSAFFFFPCATTIPSWAAWSRCVSFSS